MRNNKSNICLYCKKEMKGKELAESRFPIFEHIETLLREQTPCMSEKCQNEYEDNIQYAIDRARDK